MKIWMNHFHLILKTSTLCIPWHRFWNMKNIGTLDDFNPLGSITIKQENNGIYCSIKTINYLLILCQSSIEKMNKYWRKYNKNNNTYRGGFSTCYSTPWYRHLHNNKQVDKQIGQVPNLFVMIMIIQWFHYYHLYQQFFV